MAGSGPAYIYQVVEALADGGVMMGLPRDLALEQAAAMVEGSAAMVLQTEKHPAALKDEVCSPGGSTIRYTLHWQCLTLVLVKISNVRH